MVEHRCHAKGCTVVVPPKMFMCKRHWYMLPKKMRDGIWSLYVPRQEISKNPTMEYLEHACKCIEYIALKEKISAESS